MNYKIKYHKQETEWTCGPAVAKMLLGAFGIKKSEKQLIKKLKANKRNGTKDHAFYDLIIEYNLAYTVKNHATLEEANKLSKKSVVIISFLPKGEKWHHYAIIKRITKNKVTLIDPYFGSEYKMPLQEFCKRWGTKTKYYKEKNWLLAVNEPQ